MFFLTIIDKFSFEYLLVKVYHFLLLLIISSMDKFYSIADDYSLLSATMSAGKTANGKLYCEVPTNASKITIKYDASWLDDNNIEFVAK